MKHGIASLLVGLALLVFAWFQSGPKTQRDPPPDVLVASLITYWQAIVLGLLQGVAELFPISSLGHSVILPRLLGWDIHQNDKYFITFLVATHLATALVLLGFFWRDWVRIVKGLGREPARPRDRSGGHRREARLAARGRDDPGRNPRARCSSTSFASVFASPQSAAFFLILNGFLLYGAELLRRRAPQVEEDDDAPDRPADDLRRRPSASARRRRSR